VKLEENEENASVFLRVCARVSLQKRP